MLTGDFRYITQNDIKSLFPKRPSDCHKGSFGYVALIGGSLAYSGAIRLAAMANAAMRSGAGVATVAAPRSICPAIAPQILEATLYPLSDNEEGNVVFNEEEFAGLCKRYDCIAIGMGIGNTDETREAVRYFLTHYDKTLIIDADGLNAMSGLEADVVRSSKARILLTPHLMEFSRLTGMAGLGRTLTVPEIRDNPVESAKSLAKVLDVTILLKGPTTYVADPDGTVLATDRGCAGMATAGSGDVLSGILSAICHNACNSHNGHDTGEKNLVLSAAAGAYINGAAGELAESRRSDVTMTSADTAMCVAEVIEGIIQDTKE